MNKDHVVLAEICQNMGDQFVKDLERTYLAFCKKNAHNEITPMLPVALAQAAGWMLSSWGNTTKYPRVQLAKEFEAMFKQAFVDQHKWEQEQKAKIKPN